MAERTPEYQRQIQNYLKSIGGDPRAVEGSSDQQAYNYALQMYARKVAESSEKQERTPPQNIRVTKTPLGDYYATDMGMHGDQLGDCDQLRVYSNGTIIPRDGRVLNTLIAMKSLDQSLPDFLRELAEGDK